jgi:hypothetical protein
VLYSFTGPPDGEFPDAGLVLDPVGNICGTTTRGGDPNCNKLQDNGPGCGTAFKLTGAGKESVLYSFTGGTDGALPSAGLVRDSTGNLYGVTVSGGGTGCGG